MSENPVVTQNPNTDQTCLTELSHYLRLRKKYWAQLNDDGLYLIDLLIMRAVARCKNAGLIEQARKALAKDEELPRFKEAGQEKLGEIFLTRLKGIAKLIADGKRYINAQKRQEILERALRSTYDDLKDLGLAKIADQILSRFEIDSPKPKQRNLVHTH